MFENMHLLWKTFRMFHGKQKICAVLVHFLRPWPWITHVTTANQLARETPDALKGFVLARHMEFKPVWQGWSVCGGIRSPYNSFDMLPQSFFSLTTHFRVENSIVLSKSKAALGMNSSFSPQLTTFNRRRLLTRRKASNSMHTVYLQVCGVYSPQNWQRNGASKFHRSLVRRQQFFHRLTKVQVMLQIYFAWVRWFSLYLVCHHMFYLVSNRKLEFHASWCKLFPAQDAQQVHSFVVSLRVLFRASRALRSIFGTEPSLDAAPLHR